MNDVSARFTSHEFVVLDWNAAAATIVGTDSTRCHGCLEAELRRTEAKLARQRGAAQKAQGYVENLKAQATGS